MSAFRNWILGLSDSGGNYTCPCMRDTLQHRGYVEKKVDKSPNPAEFLDDLEETESVGTFEYDVVNAMAVLRRVDKDMELNDVFNAKRRILKSSKNTNKDVYGTKALRDRIDEQYLAPNGDVVTLNSSEVEAEINRRFRSKSWNNFNFDIANVARKDLARRGDVRITSALSVLKNEKLLDEDAFQDWLEPIKQAVEVLYKKDRTRADIRRASKTLAEQLNNPETRRFISLVAGAHALVRTLDEAYSDNLTEDERTLLCSKMVVTIVEDAKRAVWEAKNGKYEDKKLLTQQEAGRVMHHMPFTDVKALFQERAVMTES